MNTPTSSGGRSQTNQSSLRTAIKKVIRLGTTSTSSQKRAMILSFFAMGVIFGWLLMGMTVRECNDSVVMQIANRSSIEESIQCLIFHKECSCRISPNETLFLERCLPRLQLFVMRIMPAISVVLQLFAFRELITLGTDGNRFCTPVAWVMYPLVTIGVEIAMFFTHCYHIHLGFSIFLTSDLLAMLVFHDCTENEHLRRNTNQSAQPLESADNDPRSWKQLL